MGMSEGLSDDRFTNNASRLENKDALNEILQQYLGNLNLENIMENLIPAGGVVGPVYTAEQIMNDPHYAAREDIIELEDPELGNTKMLGIVPKFSKTPGAVDHAGPTIGEHNVKVYSEWLGLSTEDIYDLESEETI